MQRAVRGRHAAVIVVPPVAANFRACLEAVERNAARVQDLARRDPRRSCPDDARPAHEWFPYRTPAGVTVRSGAGSTSLPRVDGHQFQRPSSATVDGTSRVRTKKASIKMPIAREARMPW